MLDFYQDIRNKNKEVRIRNPFLNGSIIDNFEDLTYNIYCTLLMTKAPTNRNIERA